MRRYLRGATSYFPDEDVVFIEQALHPQWKYWKNGSDVYFARVPLTVVITHKVLGITGRFVNILYSRAYGYNRRGELLA